MSEGSGGRAKAPAPRGKALGQHFLRDKRVIDRIIRAIAPSPGMTVVEIGAGTGALTFPLAQRGERIIALEVDESLCRHLGEAAKDIANITVVCADVMSLPAEEILQRAGLIGEYVVAGNLPYYIASAIVRRFLEAPHPPRYLVVMMQKEVAENMAARPGNLTLLGACVQFYAQPQVLFSIPPSAFSPPPKVHSAVVRLDIRAQPAVMVEDKEEFFKFLRAGFRAPRKQLRNALTLGLPAGPSVIDELLPRANIDGRRRAQTLTMEEWGRLYHTVLSSSVMS